MEFTQEFIDKVIKELDKRIEKLNKKFQCPICKNKNFSVVEGFTRKDIDKNFSHIIIGKGSTIPSISIVCNNCGYIADFVIGVLGFLPNKNEEKNEKKDEVKNNKEKK